MTRDNADRAAAAGSSDEPMSSLLVYTHNVARNLKPSQHGELAHAIHETLHYALDGDPRDYLTTVPPGANGASNGCGGCGEPSTSAAAQASTSAQAGGDAEAAEEDEYYIQPGFVETDNDERPFVSFDWCDGRKQLTLPHPKTVGNPLLSDPCAKSELSESELRQEFDVTTKFFFLKGHDARRGHDSSLSPKQIQANINPHWVGSALESLASATGLRYVDSMTLAFPLLHLDRRDSKGESVAPTADEVSQVSRVWRHISSDVRIGKLGFSDFSREALSATMQHLCPPDCPDEERRRDERAAAADAAIEESMVKNPEGGVAPSNGRIDETGPLESTDPADPLKFDNEEPRRDLEHQPVHIPSSPTKASLGARPGDGEDEMRKAYGPGPCRRPRLCTINMREQPCNGDAAGPVQGSNGTSNGTANGNGPGCWDRGLADFCKQEKILLVAHSDQRDILPSETLPTLLNEFADRLPHPVPAGKRLEPVWCLKYTALIRDRGVLADKGFIVYAEVV